MNTANSSWVEGFSIVASIVSVILAGFALWLSIVFYRMSNESSTKIKESADRIGASVDRLEILFNKLYADTFSMMKETVSDMRKHIWRDDKVSEDQTSEEAERRADEKISLIQ
jgi:sensor histidine kinase YesM